MKFAAAIVALCLGYVSAHSTGAPSCNVLRPEGHPKEAKQE